MNWTDALSFFGSTGVKPGENSFQQVSMTPPTGLTQPQVFFFYRNIWLPLVLNVGAAQGSQKSIMWAFFFLLTTLFKSFIFN